MRVFPDVDIVSCLRRVVNENTLYYKTDFEYDVVEFKNAALHFLSPKHLLWLSRESGTYCFDERSVYMTPTTAYHTWLYHASKPEEIKAFYVYVHKISDGMPRGDLYELDYPAHVEHLRKQSMAADLVHLTFENRLQCDVPVTEYTENQKALEYKYGSLVKAASYDVAGSLLDSIIVTERNQRRDEAEPADFDEYISQLSMEPFRRFGYEDNDLTRISLFDAKKSMQYGIPAFIFREDVSRYQLQSAQELGEVRYSDAMFAIRREDKPLFEYIESENFKTSPIFTRQELHCLSDCVSNAGKSNDTLPNENESLQKLLGKLNVLSGANEPEQAAELEPEQEVSL